MQLHARACVLAIRASAYTLSPNLSSIHCDHPSQLLKERALTKEAGLHAELKKAKALHADAQARALSDKATLQAKVGAAHGAARGWLWTLTEGCQSQPCECSCYRQRVGAAQRMAGCMSGT